jgi:hypothetical protein
VPCELISGLSGLQDRRLENLQACRRVSTFRVLLGGPQQIHVIDPKRDRQFVDRDDRWIAVAALKTTEILLTESRNFCKLLLCQTLFLSNSPDVLSDQSAHIHARRSADYIL